MPGDRERPRTYNPKTGRSGARPPRFSLPDQHFFFDMLQYPNEFDFVTWLSAVVTKSTSLGNRRKLRMITSEAAISPDVIEESELM